MAEVDILVKGIKEIYKTRGSEVFSDARMFKALLDDLVPGVSNERRIIHKTVDDVLLKDLFSMVTDNSSNKQLEAMRIIKKIEDSCGLSPKYSCLIVETFCAAFDISVDFTSYKQNIKKAEEKSKNNSTDTHSRKMVKPVEKNVNVVSDFDDKKIINSIYYCEIRRKVLENRIKQIDKRLMSLQKEEKAVSQIKVPAWNDSKFFCEYKNAEKKFQSHPLRPSKPQKILIVKGKVGIFSNIFSLLLAFPPLVFVCMLTYMGILWLKDGDITEIVTGIIFLIPMLVVLSILVYKKIIKKIANRRRELKKYKLEMLYYEETCKSIDEENANASIENEQLLNAKKEQYDEWAKKEVTAIEEKRQKSNIVIANERNMFNKEKDIANATLLKLKNLLDFLYSLKGGNSAQYLHKNYQGFIPVAVIYGYFDMGRCNSLRGYQGAYNLYEDEKSKGIINERNLFNINNVTMSYPQNAYSECEKQADSLDKNTKSLIDNEALISKEILIDIPAANDTYYKEIDLKLDEINAGYSSVA